MRFFKSSASSLWVTATIIVVCTLLQSLPETYWMSLRYERMSLTSGELWRGLSAHFVHLGWRHLILNCFALLLLAALFEQAWRAKDILLGSLVCAITISIGFYFLQPGVSWYVGYSGVLHGLFVIAAARLFQQQRAYASLLLLGLIIKLGIEIVFGSAQNEAWLGGAVVEQSHYWGAIGGAIYVIAGTVFRRIYS